MSPLISVLLPARNAAPTLRPAIRSVLRQTLADFELLLLDDGSTDDTIAIAHEHNDARMRILPIEGQPGLVARLNQGINAATGRFIARMDADDVCFPTRFEKQVSALQDAPSIDLIGSRALGFNDAGEATGLLPFRATHEEICAKPWLGFYLAHPTWMGRAEWFRKHKYRVPEVLRAEDQELLLRAMPVSRFAALPDVLLGYRCRPPSVAALWTARRSWLSAQLVTFAARGQPAYCAAALTAYVGRIWQDLAVQIGQRHTSWPVPNTPPPMRDTELLRELLETSSD